MPTDEKDAVEITEEDEGTAEPEVENIIKPEEEEEEEEERSEVGVGRPIIVERILEAPPDEEDSLADLFEVPQEEDNDIRVDDLFELPDDEDISDLTSVSDEDVMRGEPVPGARSKRKVRYVRRTSKGYNPPPTMGGIRA